MTVYGKVIADAVARNNLESLELLCEAGRGLVAHGGRQVDGLLGVVLGERLDLAAVARGTLARQEGKRAVTRVLVLTMRHGCCR